jgi:DNA polymerase III epsilon subunit-like protein
VSAIVFLDCETTGLGEDDHIWEFAAIRREHGKPDTEIQFFIEHDVTKVAHLPEAFRADHDARYDPDLAVPAGLAAALIDDITRDRAYIVGAVPNFDTERLARLLRTFGFTPQWNHRLRCVETLYAGFVGEFVGGLSDVADRLGIDHPAAHTAMGDVLTTRAVYDAVMGR